MEIKISVALHIIGIAMWVGGLLVLTRFFKLFTAPDTGSKPLIAMIGRVFFGYVVPGLVIALCTGLYQISYRGVAFYMAQGWFHTKLTMILILLVATGLCFMSLKKIRNGAVLSKGLVGAQHGLVGLVLLVTTFITVLYGSLIQ